MSSSSPPVKETAKPLLQGLLNAVASEMAQVENMIQHSLNHQISLIPDIGRHLITQGGKRLRPMMLVACARLCGYKGDAHIKLATCLEFIHNATLLHDDVMDKSLLRRGKPTAHHIWGTPASIVVGDFLLCRALELMTEVQSWPIVHLINHMATKIIEGQTLDLSLGQRLDITQEMYLNVIHLKTAWLFQAACELGALLTDHPSRESLRQFGHHLGIAFQLIDDVLDYISTADTLGKNPGQDFQEGKVTLPVIFAFAHSTPSEKEFWIRVIQDHQQTSQDFSIALDMMKKYHVFEAVVEKAQTYLKEAEEHLSAFPESPLKRALLEVVRFIHQQALS